MIKFIKQIIRKLQEFFERYIFGDVLQKIIWKYGLVYRKHWPNGYHETIDTPHYHRHTIVNVIKGLDIDSICEVACGNGFNLIQLRKTIPQSYLIGVDINTNAITRAKEYFKNDINSRLLVSNADNLTKIANNSIDVVLCDALFMFVTPNKVDEVMSGLIRIARKYVILNEYSKKGVDNGFFYGGRWIYDLPSLISKHNSQAIITIDKSPIQEQGAWCDYGKLIIASLEK